MEKVLVHFLERYLASMILLGIVLLVQGAGLRSILRGPVKSAPLSVRLAIWTFALGSFALVIFGFALQAARVAKYFPAWWLSWGRALLLSWALLSVFLVLAFGVTRLLSAVAPRHNPARRNFLRIARLATFGAPAAVLGYGAFIERTSIHMREQTIAIPGLDPALNGVRLVQLTDIHLSPFLSVRELDRAIAMANETKAQVALVTGDLITGAGDPLDQCLEHLSRLRADAGIFGCLGNHEVYAGVEDHATERGAQVGIRFLRGEAQMLRFGNAALNLAGVDYQPQRRPYLRRAKRLVQPGAFNILLSHNPDVFPVAVRQGYGLTISGHTHGGQVRVEILGTDLNVARFFTPYVDGLYTKDSSFAFVSRGIGTIVVPARLGSAPEVALLRLKAS